ncbi:hypothetical protein [Methylobacterium platani]|uniref:hypothetical protein n=1 Tax=Methylobacterium platani TaxID=427683 RepID=UPI0012E23E34|nr:hypothetical protein [Methylobacterium platani]
MSDYASVAEEARRAFASVARLELASMREPESKALRINLAAKQKLANQLRARLLEAAEESNVEICNYRLVRAEGNQYGLAYVSESMLGFQYLFTQIYDSKKTHPKSKATFGTESLTESLLELGYTYSGSLGVVLMAPTKRDLFSRNLDSSIEELFDVVEVNSAASVKEVANKLGNAVVKRLLDWSKANVRGGFDADVRWNRSDGRQLGQFIDKQRMEKISNIIEATSDVSRETVTARGTLVGIDVKAGNFHLVVPNGEDYRGKLSDSFSRDRVVQVNHAYNATIIEEKITTYATDKTVKTHTLVLLNEINS